MDIEVRSTRKGLIPMPTKQRKSLFERLQTGFEEGQLRRVHIILVAHGQDFLLTQRAESGCSAAAFYRACFCVCACSVYDVDSRKRWW